MSMDPQMIMQLMQGLGQQPQQGQTPVGVAGQLAQKVALMQALQRGQQPPRPAALPGMPQPQAPAAMPMPGAGQDA